MSGALPGGLTARMALSAHGWGVVIDGVLNVRTVSDSRNAAACAALAVLGIRVISNCIDPECDCYVKGLAKVVPQARLVPVVVEVRQE